VHLFRSRQLMYIYFGLGSLCAFILTSEADKGHKCQSNAGEGMKNRAVLFFPGFYIIFHFAEFCSTCYFEFLNPVLTKKILKWALVFVRIFYFNFFQFFKNFKFDRPVFNRYFNPWVWVGWDPKIHQVKVLPASIGAGNMDTLRC
jgi:hypothetical protein